MSSDQILSCSMLQELTNKEVHDVSGSGKLSMYTAPKLRTLRSCDGSGCASYGQTLDDATGTCHWGYAD